MKVIITENRLERIAIKWLNDNYGDLESYERDIYPSYIFFKKDDSNIFNYSKKYGIVVISYGDVWQFLESMFNMDEEQIQDITKKWIEKQYNLEVNLTTRSNNPHL